MFLAPADLTSDLQDGVLRCGQCMLDAAVAAARTSALEQAAREAASPRDLRTRDGLANLYTIL